MDSWAVAAAIGSSWAVVGSTVRPCIASFAPPSRVHREGSFVKSYRCSALVSSSRSIATAGSRVEPARARVVAETSLFLPRGQPRLTPALFSDQVVASTPTRGRARHARSTAVRMGRR